ncbi:MBOAT family protein [bacterium]|nr:MBOAT family protein [bacterium]
MVFSSPVFLFVFLPFVWFVHALLPERARKPFLLLASLGFYMYGEGIFVLLMLMTILTAHCSVIFMRKFKCHRSKIALGSSLLAILILVIFKYSNFFTAQIAPLLARFSINITPTQFHLPLGISFFTFQAVSCIIDFYRKPDRKYLSFLDTALYISFFPQLVAGPIVRYDTFIPQLKYRAVHYAAFLYGLKRFIYGLAKKVLISNNLAPVVDKIYSLDTSAIDTFTAWAAPLLFGIQLYFDFSGYSDMAIGLARMFGIRIPENFNYPFAATSMTNFWRRWHISLSTWFRDYLYIPLGGSRKGEFRTIVNVWIVFLICGLWHGAAWNFIFFGVVISIFMTCERFYRKKCSFRSSALAHVYTLFVVIPLFFASFRTNSPAHFFSFLSIMLVPRGSLTQLVQLFDAKTAAVLVAGTIFLFPVYGHVCKKFGKSVAFKYMEALLLAVLFAFALTSSSMVFSDPFVYFRF